MWVANAARIPATIPMAGHSIQSGWPITWRLFALVCSDKVVPEGIVLYYPAHEGYAQLFALMQPRGGWAGETKDEGSSIRAQAAQYTSECQKLGMQDS